MTTIQNFVEPSTDSKSFLSIVRISVAVFMVSTVVVPSMSLANKPVPALVDTGEVTSDGKPIYGPPNSDKPTAPAPEKEGLSEPAPGSEKVGLSEPEKEGL